jgi:hypothetical protein
MVSLRELRGSANRNNSRALALRPNTSGLNILANAAAGNMQVVKPRVSFQRTRKVIKFAGQSLVTVAAIKGLETLLPGSYLAPHMTAQLVLAIPQAYQNIKAGRAALVSTVPAVTVAWYITYLAASGIMQSYVISQNSSAFAKVGNLFGRAVEKHIKGSAARSSFKYQFMKIFGHFIYAYMTYRGAISGVSANKFASGFAANSSGAVGRSLVNGLKFGYRAAKADPMTTAIVATGVASLALRAATLRKNTTSRSRSRGASRRLNLAAA